MRLTLTTLTLLCLMGSSLARTTDRIAALEQEIRSLWEEGRSGVEFREMREATAGPAGQLNADPRIQLMYRTPAGRYVYYEYHNVDAAASIRVDRLWPGGESGLNLDGSGIVLGMWDAGAIRESHQEFGGRVSLAPAEEYLGDDYALHATLVAGVMAAAGVDPAARGMAPAADVHYWSAEDDDMEIYVAAAAGLIHVSNHSYGIDAGWGSSGGDWYWFGDPDVDAQEEWRFGYYDSKAEWNDWIANIYDTYVMVRSAGNHRSHAGPGEGGEHYVQINGSWELSTETRQPDGGELGYECLTLEANAKNTLVVGAVYDLEGDYVDSSSVVMTHFSSYGPTDDGRIKPDLVSNGTSLYTTRNTGDAVYATSSGTSLSSPTVAGTVGLLQDLFKQGHEDPEDPGNGRLPLSSTIRGLLIHTAEEAGNAPGPDYRFGFGLLNAQRAAELLQHDSQTHRRILERELEPQTEFSLRMVSDGGPARITLAWTDPGADPLPQDMLDDPTPRLVNDLDVELMDNATGAKHFPWCLNPADPAAPAFRDFNHLDNVELIQVPDLPAGDYTLTVRHTDELDDPQKYSLIFSGVEPLARLESLADDTQPAENDTVEIDLQFSGGLDLAAIEMAPAWPAGALQFIDFSEGDLLDEGGAAGTTLQISDVGDSGLRIRIDRDEDEAGLNQAMGSFGILRLHTVDPGAQTISMDDCTLYSTMGEGGQRVEAPPLTLTVGDWATGCTISLNPSSQECYQGQFARLNLSLSPLPDLGGIFARVGLESQVQFVEATDLGALGEVNLSAQEGEGYVDLMMQIAEAQVLMDTTEIVGLDFRLVNPADADLQIVMTSIADGDGEIYPELLTQGAQVIWRQRCPSTVMLRSPSKNQVMLDNLVHFEWAHARDPYLGQAHEFGLLIDDRGAFGESDTIWTTDTFMSVELDNGDYWWKVIARYDLGPVADCYDPRPFFIGLGSQDIGGTESWEDPALALSETGGGKEEDRALGAGREAAAAGELVTGMLPNRPNPFNPSTWLRFQLAKREHVRLRVYDLLGRQVEVIIDRQLEAGEHSHQWTVSPRLASGIYLVALETSHQRYVHRVNLVR